MNFLTVAAIFKNEAHIIKEWVEHYINEGADHFVLIDNGSTDNYQKELEEFQNKGLITIIHDDTKWGQIELYNKYFPNLRDKTQWLLICDLDEFVYARRGFRTIKTFLKKLPREAAAVRIPWKVFGSSGHVKQPGSVVNNFKRREETGTIKKEWMPNKERTLSKVIVRAKQIGWHNIHYTKLIQGIVYGPDKKELAYPEDVNEKHYQPISEELLKNSYLHLNHYAIQSLEWFQEIKMKRGDASTDKHEEVRTLNYFKDYDKNSNVLLDDELANKNYSRRLKDLFPKWV